VGVPRRNLWYVAKTLELVGMVLVLVGLVMSIDLGMRDEGLASMAYEGKGLLLGGALFVTGWILERSIGTR
jgi:hypothetical protein